jgi:hypothetical protein
MDYFNYLLELIQWTIDSPIQAVLILILAYIILFAMYNQKRFRRLALAFKYPFAIYDTLVNMTAFSILMVELPQPQNKEFTVTARLKRYLNQSWSWDTPRTYRRIYHYYVAVVLCHFAHIVDKGHCDGLV